MMTRLNKNNIGSLATLLALVGMADALDLQFKKIECDTSLPAFAYKDDITVECQNEKATGNTRDDPTRCSLGDSALVSGIMYYQDLELSGLVNNTGYVSANLDLMTLEFDLFQLLPFNFCDDWVRNSQYNYNTCPDDGKYHFEVPYTIPLDFDATTWFATGWKGESYLQIHAGRNESSALLAQCKLTFETHVTQSNEEGWRTLPTAAQTTLAMVGLLAAMFLCICCLACGPRKKHVTDDAFASKRKEDPITEYRTMEEARDQEDEAKKAEKAEKEKEENNPTPVHKAYKFSQHMKYPN